MLRLLLGLFATTLLGPPPTESLSRQYPSDLVALAMGPDGSIYVGGAFWRTDTTEVQTVARLTEAGWEPLGGAFGGTVRDLAVTSDGSLILALSFFPPSGEPAVQRWTGSAWEPLGETGGWDVSDLAAGPDGSLVAASGSGIVRWTGAGWQTLGDSLVGGSMGTVAVGLDGTIYAGGRYENLRTGHVDAVLRWTGTAWEPPGDGVTGIVKALAVAPDGSLYVGGEFSYAGGPAADVARWTGAAWDPLGGGESGVDGMRYDGVEALAVATDGTLYVGGRFQEARGIPARSIVRWTTGRAWEALGDGTDGPIQALLAHPDGSLYIAGYLGEAGGRPADGAARWNGEVWEALP